MPLQRPLAFSVMTLKVKKAIFLAASPLGLMKVIGGAERWYSVVKRPTTLIIIEHIAHLFGSHLSHFVEGFATSALFR